MQSLIAAVDLFECRLGKLRRCCIFSVELWHDLLDGFEQMFGCDMADFAFIGTAGRIGDAVFSIVIPPSLDGAPCELAWMTVLVEEGHVTDGLVTS